ncbi:unnamed protein product [Protopolystoma xenopodis]|uniref:Uncharacterized protein n=1 Tax=Protopolystoma xenopodis TaxID=117903 RepID=A0A3S5CNS0_9PLAT|nr:unnamed protein product [Protopolystoma xenopodis]
MVMVMLQWKFKMVEHFETATQTHTSTDTDVRELVSVAGCISVSPCDTVELASTIPPYIPPDEGGREDVFLAGAHPVLGFTLLPSGLRGDECSGLGCRPVDKTNKAMHKACVPRARGFRSRSRNSRLKQQLITPFNSVSSSAPSASRHLSLIPSS